MTEEDDDTVAIWTVNLPSDGEWSEEDIREFLNEHAESMTIDGPIDSEERMRRVIEADGLIAKYKAYFSAWAEIARRKMKR